jgi:hypothetical protein
VTGANGGTAGGLLVRGGVGLGATAEVDVGAPVPGTVPSVVVAPGTAAASVVGDGGSGLAAAAVATLAGWEDPDDAEICGGSSCAVGRAAATGWSSVS